MNLLIEYKKYFAVTFSFKELLVFTVTYVFYLSSSKGPLNVVTNLTLWLVTPVNSEVTGSVSLEFYCICKKHQSNIVHS